MSFVRIPELTFLTNLHRVSQRDHVFESVYTYTHIYSNCKLYVGVSAACSGVIHQHLLSRK